MGELQSIGWFVNWYKPKVSKTTFEFSATFQVLGVLNREPEFFFLLGGWGGSPPIPLSYTPLGEASKKLFFYFRSKRGGGSRPIQKIPTRKYLDFLTNGGGVSPNPKGFYMIFGKKWGFYIKKNW